MSTTTPAFDALADNYNEALESAISVSGEDKEFFARGRVRWLRSLLERMAFQPGAVMDFGCGTGTATPYLLDELGASSILGVDVSSRSLEVARSTYKDRRAEFRLVEDYSPLGTVSLAFCNGVFHHIPPEGRAAALCFIYDSLEPGGLFALWENNPWNPGTRYVMSRCVFDRDAVTVAPPEARRLVRAAGFEVLRTDFFFIFPRVLSWLRPMEPVLSRLPLGTQYEVLCRKPQSVALRHRLS